LGEFVSVAGGVAPLGQGMTMTGEARLASNADKSH